MQRSCISLCPDLSRQQINQKLTITIANADLLQKGVDDGEDTTVFFGSNQQRPQHSSPASWLHCLERRLRRDGQRDGQREGERDGEGHR